MPRCRMRRFRESRFTTWPIFFLAPVQTESSCSRHSPRAPNSGWEIRKSGCRPGSRWTTRPPQKPMASELMRLSSGPKSEPQLRVSKAEPAVDRFAGSLAPAARSMRAAMNFHDRADASAGGVKIRNRFPGTSDRARRATPRSRQRKFRSSETRTERSSGALVFALSPCPRSWLTRAGIRPVAVNAEFPAFLFRSNCSQGQPE